MPCGKKVPLEIILVYKNEWVKYVENVLRTIIRDRRDRKSHCF